MGADATGPFDGPEPGVAELIAAFGGEFTEFAGSTPEDADPLGWPGYPAQRARAAATTGGSSSVHCGHLVLGGRRAIVIGFDFRFLGGSIGKDAGDRIVAAFDVAHTERLPVVSLIASGGTRIQEGMCALAQLHRIAEECHRLSAAALPHIAVLRSPTTGGVWASLAGGADVSLALSGAVVCFGGARVRAVTSGSDGAVSGAGTSDSGMSDSGTSDRAPDAAEMMDAFSAEAKFEHGQVDQIVEPGELGPTLARWLDFLSPDGSSPRPADVPRALGAADPAPDGWAAVSRARDPHRPGAARYVSDYFDQSMLISGDRAGGRDPALLCGLGARRGRTIAFVAQTGTPTTPAGFRTATRLIRLAERLRLPVLTLVDTPGAANDAAAERAAVGPAIAELFAAVAAATIPITTLVIGEGGSGGALALCAPDRLWITPDGYFAVIAPEAAAAILKRPAEEVAATAHDLCLRPQDLLALGVVHGIATPTHSTSLT